MAEKTNWPLVWLIWAAGLGAAAQYAKIAVVFDRLPTVYPAAGAGLGFAVSLVGFIGIALGVVAGLLVARIGYRRALLWALLGGAGLSALQALWPPLPVFLGLRLLEGAAHLAIVVAAPTLIAEICAPRDQGRALTLWGSFFGVAFAVLGWGGAPFVEAFGLSALMLAHALYMALMAALLWRRVPWNDGAAPRFDPGAALRAHGRIYGSARVGAAAWGWLFYTFAFVSVLTVLPPFIPEAWRSFTMGAMPLLSILSSLTLGVALLRVTSPVTVIVLGFAVSGAAMLGMLALPGSPVLALVLGAGLGLTQGASFAAVAALNHAPEARALGNGGMAQMGNLGNTAGTPVMLLAVSGFGFAGLVWLAALAFAMGALVHLWLAARRG